MKQRMISCATSSMENGAEVISGTLASPRPKLSPVSTGTKNVEWFSKTMFSKKWNSKTKLLCTRNRNRWRMIAKLFCQTLLVEGFESWKDYFFFERSLWVRGWSKMTYAIGFKYRAGSYTDHVRKKLRSLLEIERNVTLGSRINQIVFGLPPDFRKCIDRKMSSVWCERCRVS